MTARARAPIVVSAMATRLIGPYPARDDGRLKIPTPMIDPTMSAVAGPRPRVARGSGSATGAGPAGGADAVLMEHLRRSSTAALIPATRHRRVLLPCG